MFIDKPLGQSSSLIDEAAPMVNRAAGQASALAQRGVDAMLDSTKQLRKTARRASRLTVNYIEDQPVKSVLIAAAAVAVLMAVFSLVVRPFERRH